MVIQEIAYEGADVIALYSNEEAARMHAEALELTIRSSSRDYRTYTVEQWEVKETYDEQAS